MEVGNPWGATVARIAKHLTGLKDTARIGTHGAAQVGIHREEAITMTQNNRATARFPVPEGSGGGGTDRGIVGWAIYLYEIERVTIPGVVSATCIALDDLPRFARWCG